MAAIQLLERKRQSLQADLDSQRSRDERNRLGQFATPGPLALDMAHLAADLWLRRDPIHFLDPAIGSGAFFSALLRAFPNRRIASARGFDLDSRFAEVAGELWSDRGLKVETADFTTVPPPLRAKANLVIANPPYVRHHHLSGPDKTRLQHLATSELGLQISGLAGLYVYFLLLTHLWMRENGLAVWLIPSEFLDVNYGSALRRYLSERVTLIQLHRFDPADVQFADALVSSAVLVFRAKKPPPGHVASFSHGGSLTHPRSRESVPLSMLSPRRKWSGLSWGLPGSYQVGGPILSDFFSIKRGIATGDNEFFVLRRERARELDIPETHLRPILPPPRYLAETVIEPERDGYPAIPNQRVVIDCSIPETRLRDEAPGLYGYLQRGVQAGVAKGYLASRRSPWYQQERRSPSPFLCTYMGRGTGEKSPFRFFLNRSKAIAANVYLMLYPMGSLKAALEHNPRLSRKVLRFLNSIRPDLLRSGGRVYGGALHKLEPRELGQIQAKELESIIPRNLRQPIQIEMGLDGQMPRS